MSELNETYAAFVAKLFNRTGDLSKDFCHAALGITTEMRELALAFAAKDEVNTLEEGGDLTFFYHAFCLVMQELHPNPDVDVPTVSREVYEAALAMNAQEMIQTYCTEMHDIAKRWVGYGKAPTTEQAVKLVIKMTIVVNIVMMDVFPDTDREVIMKANMAKLLVRYPGGEFDAFRAVNRDTGAEREALALH